MFIQLNLSFFVIIVSFAFFAAMVHGTIGFGFPMVSTPLFALFFDLQTAIALTLIPTLAINLVSIAGEGHFREALQRFFPLALLAMTGSAIGTQLLLHSASDIFKLFLAAAILVYLGLDKINIRIHQTTEHPQLAKVVFGLCAGVLGGLTNVMAPVLIVYSLESGHNKAETVQAANLCFLFGKIVQSVLFLVNGKIHADMLSPGTAVFLAAGGALFLGMRIRQYLNDATYRQLLRGLLFLLALLLVVQFAVSLT
ncbi:MAG: sulfite exporter TauE/SafE family protein [Desulforhopalus sp.]|nr:sulfite exporter TauE/SafE family protein [Desulforhopalus sp.]